MKKDIGSILGPICIIAVIAMFVIGMIQEGSEFKTRLEDEASITTIAECEIVNKYDKWVGVKPRVKTFYYEVDYVLPNGQHHTEAIKTSGTFYNTIDVGDVVQCEVAYDDEGVFYLKPTNDNF